MAIPKVCVLRAPGTNCDVETAYAFEVCGAKVQRVHLFRVLENPRLLADFQVLCIPGGFSYGDDIGAGVIFSSQLRGHLSEALGEYLQADKLVLGICNGLQVLLKSGILPGGAPFGDALFGGNAYTRPVRGRNFVGSLPNKTNRQSNGGEDRPSHDRKQPSVTLTWNDNGKFTALWVRLGVVSNTNVFLRGLDEIELPIAHAEGKMVVRDESLLEDWRRNGQIALCYRRQNSSPATSAREAELPSSRLPYPHNPNGSVANLAGLGDPSGRILGLMPHPERFIHATQHPQWTRRGLRGEGDGIRLFRNAVEYFH